MFERDVIANQKTILKNQATLLKGQGTIVANQKNQQPGKSRPTRRPSWATRRSWIRCWPTRRRCSPVDDRPAAGEVRDRLHG